MGDFTHSSEEVGRDYQVPPDIKSFNSGAWKLNQALGHDKSQPFETPQTRSGRSRQSSEKMRSSVAQAHLDSARKRAMAQSQQYLEEPSLSMPTVQHEVEEDIYATEASHRSPYQSRAQASGSDIKPGYERRRPTVQEEVDTQPKTRSQKQKKQQQPPSHSQPNSIAQFLWSSILYPGLTYAASLLWMTANHAKPIIAYALAIYLLVGALIIGKNLVFSRVSYALSPICSIPGAGLLNLPFCSSINNDRSGPVPPVEFDQLVSAQVAFEDVVSTAISGGALPQAMKFSESSIRDLRHVVEYSTIPSRNELVFEFTGFIDMAKKASSDLNRYNSRIGRAVDHMLVANRWTLHTLDEVAETEASQARSLSSRFLSSQLNIFAPFQMKPKETRDMLFDQYVRHTSDVEEQIQSLLAEAMSLLQVLDNLDERLDMIAGIATRDGVKVQGNKDELLADLFTKLGGRRSSVQRLERELDTLKSVSQYRKMAWAHVNKTILKLQAIAAHLEDLKASVAKPELEGKGTETPLEMHVQEITMGIERLQTIREEGRRIEDERHRRILDSGNRDEGSRQRPGWEIGA